MNMYKLDTIYNSIEAWGNMYERIFPDGELYKQLKNYLIAENWDNAIATANDLQEALDNDAVACEDIYGECVNGFDVHFLVLLAALQRNCNYRDGVIVELDTRGEGYKCDEWGVFLEEHPDIFCMLNNNAPDKIGEQGSQAFKAYAWAHIPCETRDVFHYIYY